MTDESALDDGALDEKIVKLLESCQADTVASHGDRGFVGMKIPIESIIALALLLHTYLSNECPCGMAECEYQRQLLTKVYLGCSNAIQLFAEHQDEAKPDRSVYIPLSVDSKKLH